MKKVCFCLKMPHKTYIGGIATIINSYLSNRESFRKQGYDISIFDLQDEGIDKIKPSLLQTIVYGYSQFKGLSRSIENGAIDILHIHTSCRTLFWKDVWLLKRIKRRFGTKIFLTIHVGDINTVFQKIPRPIHRRLISDLNECVCRVFFLSDKMRYQFIEAGMAEERTAILYNFADMPMNVDRGAISEDSEHSKDDTLNLLFVGMINRDKGIIELLKALTMLDEISVHLDVCGTITDKSIEEEFNELSNRLAGKITLHGYVSGEDKAAIFRKSDILVLPSYHEGLPIVVLEALTSGCGIISTPVGSIPEILNDTNVEWVTPASPDSVRTAIISLYKDRDRLIKMKLENIKLGGEFSKETHIKRLCGLYRAEKK